MKLSYRDLPGAAAGRPAVVLHDRGMASADRVAALVEASGAVSRMVVPFGDYGFTSSGMELAGICWYRTVPGYAGPDPLSLARAVVQVGDLLDDVDLDAPTLVGWGQGAVVALGAGLLRGDRVSSVVGVDTPAAHVAGLPPRVLAPDRPPPVLLLGASDEGAPSGVTPAVGKETLATYGIAATEWRWPGGADEDRDKAMADEIGRWLSDG